MRLEVRVGSWHGPLFFVSRVSASAGWTPEWLRGRCWHWDLQRMPVPVLVQVLSMAVQARFY